MSPIQHIEVHEDVQTCPKKGPLVVRSIPDNTAIFLEMERLAQNSIFDTDENGDIILTVSEPHSNPNVQHDLDLWMRVREYDKTNAKHPFTPVLSRKQKQQVKKKSSDW